jgi:predicted RNA-binding Zn-ribbon protein involved in translation (DUF1610 family)
MLECQPVLTVEDNDVQVICTECGSKSIIHSRAEKDVKVSDLYCSCKNPICGHTFVMTLSFSHSLSPSANQSKRLMLDVLRGMPKQEQMELLQQAQAS